MGYIKGDHWVICDSCGQKLRRSQVKKTWDGFMNCIRSCWTPRHPQDLIKTTPDRSSVPNARPDRSSKLGSTAVRVQGVLDDITLDVDSISNVSDGDAIGIEMNTGFTHWTYVNGTPAGNTVTLGTCLPETTDVGNTVYLGGVVGNETVA